MHFCTRTCMSYRDESYTARVHLAALDHNYHCDIDSRKSRDGTPQMRRVWRKRTKRWVAKPVKEEKPFVYIPELLTSVLQWYSEQEESLRAMQGKRRQVTITPVSPPLTSALVAQKSRFSSEPTPIKWASNFDYNNGYSIIVQVHVMAVSI